MIKGCQREMIVVQTQKSKVFEQAYFMLRRESRTLQHGDLLAEANLLVQAVSEGTVVRKRPRGRRAFFWMGVLAGALLGTGLFALFSALFGL